MNPVRARTSSASRLFATYAVLSLVVTLGLGLALAASYRAEADRRGVREGAALATVLATTGIEPMLDGGDLRAGLPMRTDLALRRMTTAAIADGSVVRLRVRDLDGRILFSDDGDGEGALDGSDEAAEAARGRNLAKVTLLDADSGQGGARVVEVYRPLNAGPLAARVGVLEVYLPYEPIQADIARGLAALYRGLALGLGVLYLVLASLSYVTTRRLRRQALAHAYVAEHDQLTGLANRRVFEQRLLGLTTGAVAVFDVDRFKEVNDTIGHQRGDELITAMARRLSVGLRDGDLVARLGGDEFGVVLVATTDELEAAAAFTALRDLICAPLEVAGVPLNAEASVGFVLAPQDGTGLELLQRADIAMYAAKAGQGDVVHYDPDLDHYDSDRLALVGELRRALQTDELVLHYQPTLRLLDDEVRTVEALVRWHHPRHGLLGPDRFVPAAEQTGLIDPLTEWVLTTALQQVRDWEEQGARVGVAVNVSARNLTSPGFADRVLAAVAASGLSTSRLVVEVTETALFTDRARATAELERLDRAGVRVALDDFGQGQTSLGYLSQLPLSTLKIDRVFVTDMTRDQPHAAIVRSVIALAHDLGLRVVAEGVEDAESLALLHDLGCDTAQGWAIARPMPGEQLVEWLNAHGRVVALR